MEGSEKKRSEKETGETHRKRERGRERNEEKERARQGAREKRRGGERFLRIQTFSGPHKMPHKTIR